MVRVRASLLACTCMGAVIIAAPAHASVDEYSVSGEASVVINLELCSAETQLAVRGDTGTDLDFVVTNPSGDIVHSDQALDDYFSILVEKDGSGCSTFALGVSNLGEESNTFTVVLEPVYEASTRIEKYVIQANESQTVDFKACGTSAQVSARGDGDTDVDFIIRNSDGGVVHENDDLTDETSATLAGLLSDCETFEMEVSNLGNVYNAVMVVVEPEGVNEPTTYPATATSSSLASGLTGEAVQADSEGAGEYRANANASILVNLPVCGATRLEVRGDGDTDLDFAIADESGSVVFSDYDLSDVALTTLTPDSAECETFAMEVSNLGDVYNVFTVSLTDADNRGGIAGAGEYRVSAEASTKVALRACTLTNVFVRGDGDTDLDYNVINASGDNVHSNYDYSDVTQFSLEPADGCEDYALSVSNLGEVFNVMTITMDDGPDVVSLGDTSISAEEAIASGDGNTPPPIQIRPSAPPPSPPPAPPSPRRASQTVGEGAGEYRAPANDTVRVDLPICEATFVAVEGDGDTDLDFNIYSSSGENVHDDYDLTDRTYTRLSPSGGGCETFSMTVVNLGNVFNVFTVAYGGVSVPPPSNSASSSASATSATATAVAIPPDNASTDGNNRNIAILNQTGETLLFIYWSNSATLDWGADKLGDSSTLAAGQQWNVNASDGSNACLFDFKAETVNSRVIEVTRVNVCEVTSVAFE